MSNEKDKLINMLRDKKISESDFKLLSEALSKKSICENIEESIFINPFRKIAGFKALFLGLLILVAMSLLGTYANMYLDGIFGTMLAIGINTSVKPSFLLLMYQGLIDVFVLGTLFYLSALLCGQRRIRIIDFYGTVALARYPYLILLVFFAVLNLIYPDYYQIDTSRGYDVRPTIAGSIRSFVWMACYVWQILTYMFALKESSGLEGKRFWISFILSTFIFGNILAMSIARIPLYI